MKIAFDLTLTDSEQDDLATILSCKKPEVQKLLELYGRAALMEYVSMFLGRAGLRTAAEAREVRLLMIIQSVFGGRPPNDDEVGRQFHLTASQARSLTKSVLAKYVLELAAGMRDLFAELIRSGKQDEEGNPYKVSVRNRAIIDGLNQVLLGLDGGLPPIIQQPGTVGTFLIDVASYEKLAGHFGIKK